MQIKSIDAQKNVSVPLNPKTKKEINDLVHSLSNIRDEKQLADVQIKLLALASKGPNELKEVIDSAGWWLRTYKVPDTFSADERDILENRFFTAMNSLKEAYENIESFVKENKNKFNMPDKKLLDMKLNLKSGIIEVFKNLEKNSPLININMHAYGLLKQWNVPGYSQIVD